MTKSPEQLHRELLINAYKNAGEDFLALKLTPLFARIETEADKVRHNDILEEVLLMVGNNPVGFMKRVAVIIQRWTKAPSKIVKKILALRVASAVIETAIKKG
jgi:hypothetical protein